MENIVVSEINQAQKLKGRMFPLICGSLSEIKEPGREGQDDIKNQPNQSNSTDREGSLVGQKEERGGGTGGRHEQKSISAHL